MDTQGRLRLDDLSQARTHALADIAAKHAPIVFVVGEGMVRGELVHDPELRWIGNVDWSRQDVRISSLCPVVRCEPRTRVAVRAPRWGEERLRELQD